MNDLNQAIISGTVKTIQVTDDSTVIKLKNKDSDFSARAFFPLPDMKKNAHLRIIGKLSNKFAGNLEVIIEHLEVIQ